MKTAVVTGASSGIGDAICKELLNSGFVVYGISRTRPQFRHASFRWIQLDLTKTQNIPRTAAQISETSIDLLINAAGTAGKHTGLDFDEKIFHRIFDLNFLAPIYLASSLKNKLKRSLIINISSTSDRIAEPGYALYCSSKAALNMYFDVVSLEQKNCKVISILPDYVDTPLLRKEIGSEAFDWDKTMKPEHVASFVGSIVGNHAHIPTGARIMVLNTATLGSFSKKELLYAYNVDTDTLISSQ